jgi:hypothetical protein
MSCYNLVPSPSPLLSPPTPMACLPFNMNSGEVTLTAAVAKTIAQLLAPTQQRVRISGVSLSVKGTNPNQTPVKVELVLQTDDGAGSGSSLALVKTDQGIAETLRSSALKSFGTEPAGSTVLLTEYVQVAGGGIYVPVPMARPIVLAGTNRLGLRCTATDANVAVSGRVECEE